MSNSDNLTTRDTGLLPASLTFRDLNTDQSKMTARYVVFLQHHVIIKYYRGYIH